MKNLNLDIKDTDIQTLDYSANPPFGTVQIPLTLNLDITHDNLEPESVNITSARYITMSCFSSILHYGQSVFEGLKAYKLHDGEVGIFRLNDHAKRFKISAELMGMPSFPEELFIESVKTFVSECKKYVPDLENHSFYLRPLLIASDPVIKVKSSEKFRFTIMACIAGSYFKDENDGSHVLVNKDFVRAFPGGTGEAKTAGNYAASLNALEYAKKAGFEQVLYLDALTKKKFEELGGMNFFIIKDDTIITPKLEGTILHGITRASILEIAKTLNIKSEVRDILLEEVLDRDRVKAIFASGTAATIAPIISLGVQENCQSKIEKLTFEPNPLIFKLKDYLKSTFRGKTELSEKWITRV